MSEARITSVAVIDEFRVDLANFAVMVQQALIDLELESQRALDWITHDRAVHWKNEARRAAELLARAKDDLVNARTFKRVDNYVPACIDEKKQVELAKRRLEHAEAKMEAVRRWSMAAPRAVDEFRGPVQQLMAMLDGDIPRAMSVLQRMSAALERYTSTEAPRGIQWEELNGERSDSAAQPVDAAESPPLGRAQGEGVKASEEHAHIGPQPAKQGEI
jgi:hypothetical protein